MGSSYNTFPVLDNSDVINTDYNINDFEISYTENGETYRLEVDIPSNLKKLFSVVTIKDPRLLWDPETHGIDIVKHSEISNPGVLFGPNGITNEGSVLGLAMIWISSRSDQRGVIPFAEFDKNTEKVNGYFSHSFLKAQLRGSLILKTVLYLKASESTPELKYMATVPGTVLGEFDSLELQIDGDGSSFPIVTVSKPGEPLWSVHYNRNADPLNDPFEEENVCIMLNDSHPHFESLKIKESFKDSQIFIEVLSTALMIIIQSVKDSVGDEWDAMLENGDAAPGSIAQAVISFVKDLQWDISSPGNLSTSIRKFFDNNL